MPPGGSFIFLVLLAVCRIALGALTPNDGLYMTNGTHILFSKNPSAGTTDILYSQENGRIVGLAVDVQNGFLFWSDVSASKRGIYRAKLNKGSLFQDVQHIIDTDIVEVNGLTVDWLAKHIYWTDARKRTITVAEYDGSNRREFSFSGLFSPRGIYADPINGYLFWNDQGHKIIERSRLDGSERKTIVGKGLHWPNQMMVYDNELFWVDAWNKTLMACNLEGQSQRLVTDLRPEASNHVIYGLAIKDKDTAYVTVWEDGAVLSMSLTGSNLRQAISNIGTDAVFSLAYGIDSFPKRSADTECGSPTKAGCSHLCLPTSVTSHRCSCPSYGGKTLSADNKTCAEPENILVYALGDQGEVGFLDVDRDQTIDRYLVGRSLRPVGVAYDPVEQMVYWSDVYERTVHKVKLDGTHHSIFLSYNHSIGVVDGLALDVKHRKLYYTNMGSVVVQGTYYSWHKIEVIGLDGGDVRTVVDLADKPRGLWIDEQAGYLYYTDWGNAASVLRANLDGSDRITLRAGLENPNGVVLNGNKMYVIDSHYKTRKANPTQNVIGGIYTADKSGNNWKALAGVHLETPYGLARYGDDIYVSDWKKGAILKVPTHGGASGIKPIMSNVKSPMGIFYSPRRAAAVGQTCHSTTCDAICLDSPTSVGGATCSCPSYDADILTSDGNSCKLPTNYLVFADFNAIKLVGLDSSDRSTYTVVKGNEYFSNFAALVVDHENKAVYFSDVNRRAIYYAKLDGNDTRMFYKVNHVIDGMALDKSGQRLYWTDYLTGTIASLALDGTDYKELVTGLLKPRAIVLHKPTKTMYWTEWGRNPRVAKANMDDGSGVATVASKGLVRPNGLYLDDAEKQIYIGEAENRTVMQCNLNGSGCQVLYYVTQIPEHIYDVKKVGQFIYYSDWRRGTISLVNTVSGFVTHFVWGLMRPTQFEIRNTVTLDCPKSKKCQHHCIPIPGGSYCECSVGFKLAADGYSCQEAESDWEATEDFRCSGTCKPGSRCAHLIGTKTYRCQCVAGRESTAKSWQVGDDCPECSINSYKSVVGPEKCKPCPGSSTSTSTGSTRCQCPVDLVWNWQNKSCDGVKPGNCPRPSAPPSGLCNQNCRLDGECPLASKCCEVSACSNSKQCVDPEGLQVCVYQGKIYQIGDTFKPNQCATCLCTRDKSRGDTRYGGATCTVTDCQPAMCVKEDQLIPIGSCCPVCSSSVGLTIRNCPMNKTFEYKLNNKPDSFVFYDPHVQVWEPMGRHVTMPPETGHLYFWSKNPLQKVSFSYVARNPDGTNETATCLFFIKIIDASPPNITCPGNINVYTNQQQVRVTWPPAQAVDNVGLEPGSPRSNLTQGSSLKVGNHTVIYTARDKAGNSKTCAFTVRVIKNTDQKCIPPQPSNGELACRDDGARRICTLICSKNYLPGPGTTPLEHEYTCTNNQWDPKFPAKFNSYACVKLHEQRLYSILTLSSPECPDRVSKKEVEAYVSNVIERQYVDSTIHPISLETTATGCWSMRKKRLTDSEKLSVDLQLRATEIENKTRTSAKQELTEVTNSIRDDFKAGKLQLWPSLQQTRVEKIVQPDGPSCYPGEQKLDKTCMSCPAGTYLKENNLKCTDCPLNNYQEKEGQTSCEQCPTGSKGSTKGSYSIHNCVLSPRSSSQPEEKDLALIIGVAMACGIVFIIVLGVTIGLIVYCRKAKRRRREKSNTHFTNPSFDGNNHVVDDGDSENQPRGFKGVEEMELKY